MKRESAGGRLLTKGYPIPVDHLQRARVRRGWSVTTLAERSGLPIATVSRALAGRPVSMPTLLRIAAALDQQQPLHELRVLLDGED